MRYRTIRVGNYLYSLLNTSKGQDRLYKLKQGIEKAREVLLYGNGWPLDMSNSKAQTGVQKSDDQLEYKPVYDSWEGKVKTRKFGGKLVLLSVLMLLVIESRGINWFAIQSNPIHYFFQ